MFEEKKGISLSHRCAPVTTQGQPRQQQHQPRVWALTQMGPGMAGADALTLSGIPDQIVDESGNYKGKIVYPVVSEIQHDPGVARLLRAFEFRGAITADSQTGLLYRLLPSPAMGTNSWLTSGEAVMHSLVEVWGRVTSDREAGIYRVEHLNLPALDNGGIPDVDAMLEELLSEYVIDNLEHPTLKRLLGQSPPAGNQGFGLTTTAVADEDDIDEIY